MKARIAFLALLAFIFVILAAAPATADTLYSNGTYNGTTDAWEINFGFSVSDSFIPRAAVFVEGFYMVNWNIPGFVTTSVEVQLGSTSFGSDYTEQLLPPAGSA